MESWEQREKGGNGSLTLNSTLRNPAHILYVNGADLLLVCCDFLSFVDSSGNV